MLHMQFRTLTRRRVIRKPLFPFFIHPVEIIRIRQKEGYTYNLFERTTCGFKDGLNILETLSRMFLNCFAHNIVRQRIERHLACNENESIRFHALAVASERSGRFIGLDDLLCYFLCLQSWIIKLLSDLIQILAPDGLRSRDAPAGEWDTA